MYSIAESQQTLSAGLELLRSRKGHSIVEFIDNAAVNYHFISEQKRHFFAHSFRKPSPLF
ncbi:hypothetical protein GS8_3095 [Geobacillus stearothermophilus]|uniref:Uncharacterized protein n=1 Tax=Geobacillus stearothermophilus TaxID=1422 RepID=A0ABQ7HBK2_GEOSE|nr:hypothetical protein GS8_3095 [Geobacillus stearothermophilus]